MQDSVQTIPVRTLWQRQKRRLSLILSFRISDGFLRTKRLFLFLLQSLKNISLIPSGCWRVCFQIAVPFLLKISVPKKLYSTKLCSCCIWKMVPFVLQILLPVFTVISESYIIIRILLQVQTGNPAMLLYTIILETISLLFLIYSCYVCFPILRRQCFWEKTVYFRLALMNTIWIRITGRAIRSVLSARFWWSTVISP